MLYYFILCRAVPFCLISLHLCLLFIFLSFYPSSFQIFLSFLLFLSEFIYFVSFFLCFFLSFFLSFYLSSSLSVFHSLRCTRESVRNHAIRLWIHLRKKKTVKSWIRWHRQKRHFRIVPRLSVHQMRRSCRAAFLFLAFRSTTLRRQRLCVQAADRSYLLRSLSKSLKR